MLSLNHLPPKSFQEEADLLKAMGHPIRLCILNGLSQVMTSNVRQMQHCLSVPQSTLSQHLRVLRSAGLVSCERSGAEVFYRINDERVSGILSLIMAEQRGFSDDQNHCEIPGKEDEA